MLITFCNLLQVNYLCLVDGQKNLIDTGETFGNSWYNLSAHKQAPALDSLVSTNVSVHNLLYDLLLRL